MNFDQIVERHNTGCFKYDILPYEGFPEDTIPLWVADMDFAIPQCAVDALHRMVDHAVFGYNFPTDDYLKSVQGWFTRRHSWTPATEWIVTTPGVVYALSCAVRCFSKPGDFVLVLPPVYNHFFPPIIDNERVTLSCPLKEIEGRYEIDFENLEKLVAEQKPAMTIFCSPQNPVGRVWTEAELRRFADICIENDVLIVADEIHCDFIYPGHKHIPFLSLGDKYLDHTIACTAPSKTFNLAGLQDSNIFIPNEELRTLFKKEMSAQGVEGCATPGRVACQAVYEAGDEWLDELLVYLKGTYDAADAYLKDNLPQLKLFPLEGTYLAWIDARALHMTTEELSKLLKEKAHVFLSAGPGYAHGSEGDGFLRLNLGTSRANVLEGLRRIHDALN